MNGWLEAGESVSTAVPAAQTFTVPEIAPQMLAAVSSFVTKRFIRVLSPQDPGGFTGVVASC